MVKRDWKKVFLMEILTGGLYTLYVVYCMHNDIEEMEKQTNKKQMNVIIYFLLCVCTGSLFAFIYAYSYHKRALALAKSYNVKLAIKSPLLFALVMYVPVVSFMVMIKNHNKLIDGYETSYGFRNTDEVM
ncbi:MAG: DUF4234 domain-containing protein [Acutalibacteraceae bacterium]